MRGVELRYADQVVQVALGPFVSKLVFGHETRRGETPAASVTIALPTPSVLTLYHQLGLLLAREEVRSALTASITAFEATLSEPSQEAAEPPGDNAASS
jgi:hypothetical protein